MDECQSLKSFYSHLPNHHESPNRNTYPISVVNQTYLTTLILNFSLEVVKPFSFPKLLKNRVTLELKLTTPTIGGIPINDN